MANPKNTTEKKKATRYVTPKCEALFNHVVEVDYGTKDYPDKDGSYNITVRMTAEEAEAFRDKLAVEIEAARDYMEEQFSKLSPALRKKHGEPSFELPGRDEYDRETEEPTGNVLFRFKTKAIYTDRNGKVRQRKVPLFDAFQRPVKLTDEVGYGSTVRVCFATAPYFVDGQATGGLALYLDAVQIIKLNLHGERSASDYGFGCEEEGFSADELVQDDAPSTNAPDVDSSDADAEDF